MKTLVFFNNKGGVGKTSLVYHLAWMFHEFGLSIVAADLDPQSNLSTAFLEEDRLEQLWPEGEHPLTILGAIQPLLNRLGDLIEPHIEVVEERLALIPGDLGLGLFEDRLAEAWPGCLDDNKPNAQDAFRVTTAFYRALMNAATRQSADFVLIDVGPSLGAINRAALVAADFVAVPLGADLFSLQGLKNLGPTLRSWQKGWKTRRQTDNAPLADVPLGNMEPLGYIILQHAVRKDRPVKAYLRWAKRIPNVYRDEVLDNGQGRLDEGSDLHMLGTLKHYRSLMPMAQDARKPMFLLKPADGAIGAHTKAVQDCYRDFEQLARRIAIACGIVLSPSRNYLFS